MTETANLAKIEKILDIIGIREKLDEESLLKSITSRLISPKLKDTSTLIYRIAMAIYHSGRYWKNNIIQEIDDPVQIFLKLSESKWFKEEYPEFWEKINTAKPETQTNLIRTFTSFICAAYYYLIAKKEELSRNGT